MTYPEIRSGIGPVRRIQTTVSTVLAEVAAERDRQDRKWGEQNHPNGTGPDQHILGNPPPHITNAELAEAARRRTQRFTDGPWTLTYEAILTEEVCEAYAEEDPAKLRAELIQVAAVAVAWVEKIDRDARAAEMIGGR